MAAAGDIRIGPRRAPGTARLIRGIPVWAMLFLAYLGIALATIGANPFRGESITPLDMLIKLPAYSWIEPDLEMRQRERSDILDGLLPYWMNAREQVRAGDVPMWNDIAAGGSTFLVPNNSIFTPAFAVFAAAPTPALGFHLAIALNLAIASLGMHLFLRRHVGAPAAIGGAVTFMFCGFHAAWLYWPHVHTAIWAPWLLLAIDHCVDRSRMRDAVGVGIATMMVVLGGFPFVAEMVLCTGGLYFLVVWTSRLRGEHQRARPLVLYSLGCMLGLLLCAPLLFELSQWLQQFDLGYRQNRGSYLRLEHATRLLPPWAYEFKRVEQTMYVGVVFTALAAATVAGALLLSAVRRTPPPRLVVFGMLLLAIAAGLVFGLWPMWLVGWFPGMSFNAWSRAIGILDLAIIVLAACAVDAAWKRAIRTDATWMKALVVLLVVVQACEMGHFFRRYNGATQAAYFYPEIPSVKRVLDDIGPFDYVLADRSFGFSGFLGAYGLRDWFAHQIRTPAHKKVLDDMVPKHRASHTASRFKSSDIRGESRMLSDFNVRYLLMAEDDAGAVGPGTDISKSRPLPPQPGRPWQQRFVVDDPDGLVLSAISVRLATYRERNLGGRVVLELGSPAGSTIARSQIDASTVVDNRMAKFRFGSPVTLAAGAYRFTIVYEAGDSPPRRLTAWSSPDGGAYEGLLSVGGTPHAGVLQYLLHEEQNALGPFRRVFTAAGISVMENAHAPRGPYFVANPEDHASRSASSPVSVTRYRPDAFSIDYSGAMPGYVVVPVSINGDWSIAVNGNAVTPRLKAGVLPAVPVEGPSTIDFEYDPWSARHLLAWLAALASLLLLLGLAARWRRVRGPPDAGEAPDIR